MSAAARKETYHLLLLVVSALLVAVLAIWLQSLEGSRPLEVQRASVRYSADVSAMLAQMDGRLAALEAQWQSGSSVGIYNAAKDLREGLRSLLRSADPQVDGASLTTYAPEAEKLVRELEAEYAQRNAALAAALPPEKRQTLSADVARLEAQLSDFMRIVRRDKAAAAAAHEQFLASFRAWRQALPPGLDAGPAAPSNGGHAPTPSS